jgi:Fic family protein
METTIIETYNDGLNDVFFKKYVDAIRKRRNEILQDTDHKILLDSSLDESSLSNIKIYRQELREFMNKLANDEIECNIFLDLDNFVELHFPKLL